jgi:hypothetical protein
MKAATEQDKNKYRLFLSGLFAKNQAKMPKSKATLIRDRNNVDVLRSFAFKGP